MQKNERKIAGVLNSEASQDNFRLRRYFPDAALLPLIEQFWFVDWALKGGASHTQQNLPDPNFHLTFEQGKVSLIGPVSKVFRYEMRGDSGILGVKFTTGALAGLLPQPMSEYVDKTLAAHRVFGTDIDDLMLALERTDNDEQRLEQLQQFLLPFVLAPSPGQLKLQTLVAQIKNDSSILQVEHLAQQSNLSIRAIQRCFKQYLGLSPKWLIRKYRLHQALEALKTNRVDILDLVAELGYSDQSHLIRDFKDMLGMTPNQYLLKV